MNYNFLLCTGLEDELIKVLPPHAKQEEIIGLVTLAYNYQTTFNRGNFHAIIVKKGDKNVYVHHWTNEIENNL